MQQIEQLCDMGLTPKNRLSKDWIKVAGETDADNDIIALPGRNDGLFVVLIGHKDATVRSIAGLSRAAAVVGAAPP